MFCSSCLKTTSIKNLPGSGKVVQWDKCLLNVDLSSDSQILCKSLTWWNVLEPQGWEIRQEESGSDSLAKTSTKFSERLCFTKYG